MDSLNVTSCVHITYLYSLRHTVIVSLAFFLNNCHFTIPMQHFFIYSTIIPLFIEFHQT